MDIEADANEQVISERVIAEASTLTDAESGTAPVYSKMVQQNPKFEVIAKQFVETLAEKTQDMQQCLDNTDFISLAEHAHWLKGSAGTLGFIDLVEPAIALEVSAQQENGENSKQKLTLIKKIQSRIRFDYDSNAGNTIGARNVSQSSKMRPTMPEGVLSVEPTDINADKNIISGDEPVISALPMNNENFDELAKLAHWLKGSGGNVGFDGFTQLAASLESSAMAGNREQVAISFEAIQSYSERVKLGWKLLDPLEKSA